MGISALKLEGIEPFVSPLDDGYNAGPKDEDGNPTHSDKATKWLIGTLTSAQASVLADDMASFGAGGAMTIKRADNDILAARMALRGWENFELEFKQEDAEVRGREMKLLANDVADRIPLVILRQIGQKAKQTNTLTKAEEKN